MQVIMNEAAQPTPKLMAVVAADGQGIFFARQGGGVIYLGSWGQASVSSVSHKLSDCMTGGRRPVYEGDSVTIQF